MKIILFRLVLHFNGRNINYFLSSSFSLLTELTNKFVIKLVCSVVFFSAFAQAQTLSTKDLKPGQCITDPLSKNYLSILRSADSQHYEKIIQNIGVNRVRALSDTAQEIFYFCSMTCMNQNQQISDIWVLHSDAPKSFQSMDGFLCHGVRIEPVKIVGSIYSHQPVVFPFYAYESRFPEIHDWLESQQFKINVQDYQSLRSQFSRALREIAIAYLNTGNALYIQAGSWLWEIAEDSDNGRLILKDRLEALDANHWKLPTNLNTSADLVDMSLILNGRFLPYE